MSHLELVALVVRDYDAAIRFFVDVWILRGIAGTCWDETRGGRRSLRGRVFAAIG